jgi:hypothetical protein
MKRMALLTALLTAWPLAAKAEYFLAFLHGYQEVPSVSSRADGVFQARSAGDWLSIEYALAFEGLQATIAQAHIHFAQTSVNGPIIVWLCGTTTNPGPAGTQTCPQQGTIRGTITAANVLASPSTQQLPAGAIGSLISAMKAGAAYVNVHTAVSPGGEIRGQIFQARP